MGLSIDLTNEVEERDAYRFLCIAASKAGEEMSMDWFATDGDGGADASGFVVSFNSVPRLDWSLVIKMTHARTVKHCHWHSGSRIEIVGQTTRKSQRKLLYP